MHSEVIKKEVPTLSFVLIHLRLASDLEGFLIRDFRCPSLSLLVPAHLAVAKMSFIADRERFIRITV